MTPTTGKGPRHLVLAGGGHAHVEVLRRFSMEQGPRPAITVVTPSAHAVYSGMVPGLLAARFVPDDVRIDVAALAARAGATFVPDRVVALDADRQRAVTASHGEIPWDLLSLDVGSRTDAPVGLEEFAQVVAVRPIEACIGRVEAFAARARAGTVAARAAVVGAGAGGIELAFALARVLAGAPAARVSLLERGPEILAGGSRRGRAVVSRELAARGIEVLCGAGGVRPVAGGVATADGREVPASLAIWATGARGPAALSGSGLALDEAGFLLVDDLLQAVGREDVFAAGDCARMVSHRSLPRAGVFAVRQGPPLFENLRSRSRGEVARVAYRPQRAFLSLLSTGDGGAIALWRGLALAGRTMGRLKDGIDRAFVERYQPPRAGASGVAVAATAAEMAPCGGCAAKLDAAALAGLIATVAPRDDASVAIGLSAPDDAAVLRHPPGEDVVVTVDGFPPFSGDLHAVGEIGAVNAASDVFAMGADPTGALVLLSPGAPEGAARDAELGLLLSGAAAGLARMGIPLVGGHTLSAGSAMVAFAVLGRVAPGAAMTKSGARPGDAILLTKPLGTGVVLAASRAGRAPAAWVEGALDSMRASNGPAATLLRQAGVRCCTDVSGFGLLGHLEEAMSASGTTARIDAASVPLLDGAPELVAAGWRSSAHAANRAALERSLGADAGRGAGPGPVSPAVELLCDPQTSGGLLAAVAPGRAAALLESLRAAGCRAACIGTVVERRDALVEIEGQAARPRRG